MLTSLERTVTRERLRRYLLATNQDLTEALLLYETNVALAEAMYGLLHGVEIAVRNSISGVLERTFGQPHWYDYAALTPYWRDQVNFAKQRSGATSPGRVIAELPLGFWVELTSKANHNILWMGKQLRRAFPHFTGPRGIAHDRLRRIQRLRNRISHHESIITSRGGLHSGGGRLSVGDVVECAEWVCPQTAEWLRTRFRYAEAQRILAEVQATGFRL